ncbi:hypothetical protein K440DRAFT_643923 [Wilcoxina mikolae CBS 423.85]|nr:hypothetical protein K440DRAFT_643923 [Wilcoxina mikolae CBS 423.85]
MTCQAVGCCFWLWEVGGILLIGATTPKGFIKSLPWDLRSTTPTKQWPWVLWFEDPRPNNKNIGVIKCPRPKRERAAAIINKDGVEMELHSQKEIWVHSRGRFEDPSSLEASPTPSNNSIITAYPAQISIISTVRVRELLLLNYHKTRRPEATGKILWGVVMGGPRYRTLNVGILCTTSGTGLPCLLRIGELRFLLHSIIMEQAQSPQPSAPHSPPLSITDELPENPTAAVAARPS